MANSFAWFISSFHWGFEPLERPRRHTSIAWAVWRTTNRNSFLDQVLRRSLGEPIPSEYILKSCSQRQLKYPCSLRCRCVARMHTSATLLQVLLYTAFSEKRSPNQTMDSLHHHDLVLERCYKSVLDARLSQSSGHPFQDASRYGTICSTQHVKLSIGSLFWRISRLPQTYSTALLTLTVLKWRLFS